MANRTSKLVVCIDTYREGERESPLRGVRIINEHTLKVMGEAAVGAWPGEKAAVQAAVEDFYSRGGFRVGD